LFRDVSNLAWISSSFSSVTLHFLCVILLPKIQPAAQKYSPAWNWCIRK
jgi:hypothetical protein